MRISDGMKSQMVVSSMRTAQESIFKLQQQVSSGLRIQKPSDDPNAASSIMQTRSQLRAAEQYQRNIGQAISRVEAEETILDQLDSTLTRALTLAISQGDDLSTPATRLQVKAEVDNLLQFAVSLANTRWGEGYLFGGLQADTAPFDAADPLKELSDLQLAQLGAPHRIEISPGQFVPTSHTAVELFLDSGAIESLSALSAALASGDGATVRDSIDGLRSATATVQNLLGDVGGRYNQFTSTSDALRLASMSAVRLQSELEDVDMAEALVHLAARQGVLQASYMATSRIMSMNLTDYLR
jgi:flagellar hook-associated protein 3 FlgL